MENMNKTKAHNTIVAIMNRKCSGVFEETWFSTFKIVALNFS